MAAVVFWQLQGAGVATDIVHLLRVDVVEVGKVQVPFILFARNLEVFVREICHPHNILRVSRGAAILVNADDDPAIHRALTLFDNPQKVLLLSLKVQESLIGDALGWIRRATDVIVDSLRAGLVVSNVDKVSLDLLQEGAGPHCSDDIFFLLFLVVVGFLLLTEIACCIPRFARVIDFSPTDLSSPLELVADHPVLPGSFSVGIDLLILVECGPIEPKAWVVDLNFINIGDGASGGRCSVTVWEVSEAHCAKIRVLGIVDGLRLVTAPQEVLKRDVRRL